MMCIIATKLLPGFTIKLINTNKVIVELNKDKLAIAFIGPIIILTLSISIVFLITQEKLIHQRTAGKKQK